MKIMESILAAIRELILPDLDRITEESREIKAILTLTNKRLDDVNLHLADQSRRIDETNRSLGRLYEVIVRRDEHSELKERVGYLERELAEIEQKLAV
jgi:hypothetical protein